MYRFPPKLEASVLGETIEYVCAGSGPCAVVLVNGAAGRSKAGTRCSIPSRGSPGYSRTTGRAQARVRSPRSRRSRSRMVASLRAVLQAANVAPPYVLVGHSLGGLIVNLFARLHRTEVSAAALLEATAVDDVAALAAHENALQRLTRRVLDRLVPPDPHAETRHIGSTVSELQLAPAFPTIPLRVVTGAKRAMAWATAPEALAARATHQQELAALSPLGKQVIAVRRRRDALIEVLLEGIADMPGCLSYVVAKDPTDADAICHRGVGQPAQPSSIVVAACGTESHRARQTHDCKLWPDHRNPTCRGTWLGAHAVLSVHRADI